MASSQTNGDAYAHRRQQLELFPPNLIRTPYTADAIAERTLHAAVYVHLPSESILIRRTQYESYLLLVLACGTVATQFDFLVLGLGMQSIKGDLKLSDTQLGLMTGIAFALFYSVLGFPIARIADRGNRVRLMAVTTALCSFAIILCGVARTYAQLLVLRVCVAVGETGFLPTANSLITQSFSRAERTKAFSRFMIGGPVSGVVGYMVGGWLIAQCGWRATFMMMGTPGIALAVLMWFTLHEPRARSSLGRLAIGGSWEAVMELDRPSLKVVLKTLWSSLTYRRLVFGFVIMTFAGFGRSQWTPTFFIRSFGVDIARLGWWLAMVSLLGIGGTLLGGALGRRHAVNRERRQLRWISGAWVLCALLSALMCTSSNIYAAFAWLGLSVVVGVATMPSFFSVLQSLIPENMRAQATALLMLFANLFGMGLGPLVAGAISDSTHAVFGAQSLRYTLLAFSPGYVLCAWYLWRAGETVVQDVARTDVEVLQGERRAP